MDQFHTDNLVVRLPCLSWRKTEGVPGSLLDILILLQVDGQSPLGLLLGWTEAKYDSRPSGWSFFVGLLQAAYTLTGKCLPHMTLCTDSHVNY